jgi:hypothetical protein
VNIYDLELTQIERVETNSSDEVEQLMETARRPLIFTGLGNDLEFLRSWDLDFLSKMDTKVPIQKPEEDGVNYFINYEDMPMSEVVEKIRNGDGIYIGAKQITGPKGIRSDKDGLGALAEKMKIPRWIDIPRIHNANFWLGAGNNNTLLHYDAWDSVLMLGTGQKEFVVLPDTESPRVHQYGALDFKALNEGRVLHSKIRPLDVQVKYQKKFSKAKGFRGTVKAGEVVFVPAGFWHFVESTGTNVAINFFIHVKDKSLLLREPLRTFWIKDNITLWPVRWYWNLKAKAARIYRYFFPKQSTS